MLLFGAVVIVVFCCVGSSFSFVTLPRTDTFSFIMTSGPTNNSSQLLFDESSASVAASIPQSTDVSDSAISDQAGLSSGPSLSPEIVALIGQSAQAAIAAERAKSSSSPTTSISSRAIGVFLLSQHQQRLLLNHLQVGLFPLLLEVCCCSCRLSLPLLCLPFHLRPVPLAGRLVSRVT